MSSVAGLLIAASVVVGQSDELKGWADLNVGRWVGNVKFTVDYPDVAEKGDEATAFVTIRWIQDESALEGHYHVGTGSGQWLTTWDAAKKQLVRHGVSSNGSISHHIIKKKTATHYIFKTTTVFADGTKETATTDFVFSEGGKKLVIEGSNRKRDGEPIADFRDVWRRINE